MAKVRKIDVALMVLSPGEPIPATKRFLRLPMGVIKLDGEKVKGTVRLFNISNLDHIEALGPDGRRVVIKLSDALREACRILGDTTEGL